MMTIRFVRIAGERDRIYVRRSNGTEVSWSFPTFGDGVPHDLAHLVVESRFGLRHGFWGRVDDGVDPQKINDEAKRIGGRDRYKGFGRDQRELYLAEALATLGWLTDENQLLKAHEFADDLGIELRDETFDEVRVDLAELTLRWRKLLPKGTLEMTF